MLAAGVAPRRIAIEAGVRADKLRTWLDGEDAGDTTESRIVTWLEELDQPDEGAQAWVETPTSAKIVNAFEFARNTPSITVVYGGAGVGKSHTAKRYAAQNCPEYMGHGSSCTVRGAFYVTVTRSSRSLTGVLGRIADAVGCGTYFSRNDMIEAHILERLGPGDLLIIDEAQHLGLDALDGIRAFHDEAGIGIAYLGNQRFYSVVAKKNLAADFAQLHSRIGMRLHVPNPEDGDVDAVLEAWGVRGRQERAFGQAVASRPGGLRVLVHVLRQAAFVARLNKRPLDRELMQGVIDGLRLED
jgi:DNA transposition AAA+ family ATPase